MRSIRTRALATALAAVALSTSCGPDGSAASDRPAGDQVWSVIPQLRTAEFAVSSWTADAFEATDLRFLPDGRALLITKGGWAGAGTGQVVLLSADGQSSTEILDVAVCTDAERGLLGIELDPDFPANQTFYLFYTRQMSDCATTRDVRLDPPTEFVFNRVSAFTFDEAGVDPASERVIVDDLPAHQSAHNAGGMRFLDRTLIVAVGEAGYGKSRELDFVGGKLLGIDVDHQGEGSPLNPEFDPERPSDVRSLVYASGFRNPFRFDIDPATRRVAVADVGSDEFEEVNLVRPGGDYGFPDIQGPGGDDGSERPALWYRHADGCNSIIGGAWVPAGWIPGTTAPSFAFTDFGCSSVYVATFRGDLASAVATVTPPLGFSASSIVLGPDDALYVVGIGPGPIQVQRVARTP